MFKYFFATLVAVTTLLVATSVSADGPAAPATIGLQASLFNKITALAVPIINDIGKNITIPGVSSKHFDFDSFKLVDFNVGPITFGFNEKTGKAQATVDLTQFKFAVPKTHAEIKDKILFAHIHCSLDFWAAINIQVSIDLDIDDKAGHLGVSGSKVAVDYKQLDVDYKMTHDLCKIASKILSLIVNIKSVVKHAIESKLAPALQKALPALLEKEFEKLPFTITGAPTAYSGGIQVPVNLDSFVHAQQQQFVARPPALLSMQQQNTNKNVHGLPNTDLFLQVPSTSVNTVLQEIDNLGKLNWTHTEHHVNTSIFRVFLPNAYALCADCPLVLGTALPAAPTSSFVNNNASLSVKGMHLSFGAFNKSSGRVVSLFDTSVTTEISLDNFGVTTLSNGTQVVKFAIGASGVSLSVVSSSVGKIDTSAIQSIINVFVGVIVPLFNKNFGGVPLPPGFPLSKMVIQAEGGVFTAGADVGL